MLEMWKCLCGRLGAHDTHEWSSIIESNHAATYLSFGLPVNGEGAREPACVGDPHNMGAYGTQHYMAKVQHIVWQPNPDMEDSLWQLEYSYRWKKYHKQIEI